MSIGERLRMWRDLNNLKQVQASAMLGISHSLYQKYESDRSVPGGEAVASMSRAGINANWLLTGIGDMDLKNENAIKEAANSYATQAQSQAQSEFALLTYYHIEASAGIGSFVNSDIETSQIAFRKDWLKLKGLQIDSCALLSARGDSMEPTISNGDLILIDTRVDSIKNDAIYVLNIDHSLIVKRVQQLLDGSLIIISDNKRYESQILTAEKSKDLRIAGKVSWVGHDFN